MPIDNRIKTRTMKRTAYAFWILLLLASCDSSVSLFDGKTLDGWTCDPEEQAGDWTAVDGDLVGENFTAQASILWTTQSFRDFEVVCEYMALTEDYDSGIFLRGMSQQVQIGISRSLQKDMTACIYAPDDERGAYPGQTEKVSEIHQPGEWNLLKVTVTEKRIQTFLNGESMVDYTAVVMPDEGPIGLQLHGGVHMAVKFRNIRVREL